MPVSQRRGRPKRKSEYGLQLSEKQKIRNTYLLRERQFKNYFKKAKNPEDIYALLELRLDSVIYRLGLAKTRGLARQLVNHGHIMVNSRKVDIPSYHVRKGDIVSIRPQSADKAVFAELTESLKKFETPKWIKLDKAKKEGEITGIPSLDESGMEFNMQSVMEFYSR